MQLFTPLTIVIFCTALTVQAQEPVYPARPITIVVPAAAGGANSLIARLISEKLQTRLGRSVIVDNKAGANTAVGTQFVAKAKPDGYTLLITGASTFTVNPVLFPALPYKVRDFEFIAYTGKTPLVLLTNPQTGYKSAADVVVAAMKSPATLAFASFGNGSMPHLAGEAFAHQAGISMVHVAYKGSAPGMTDLIGNQIPLSFDTLTAALPQIEGKKVIALAVTGSERSPQLPDVPTVQSAGYIGYDFSAWFAIAAPKGTPEHILQLLSKEIKAVMATPDLRRAFQANGLENTYMDGVAVRQLIDKEQARNKAVIQQAKIKID